MSFTTTQFPPCSQGTREAGVDRRSLQFSLRSGMHHTPLFASLTHSFGSITASGSGSSPNPREPNSNVEFPPEYCVRTQQDCPSLAGFGVRTKKILGIKNINVYALGVYLDVPAAKKSLSQFCQGSDAESLADKQEFYDAFINSQDFDKTLRVVVTTGMLTKDRFLGALEENLGPAMIKAADLGSLETFRRQFDGCDMRRGLEVTFTQLGPSLTLKIDGQQKAVIPSLPLCRSLFEIWLGQDAVSPAAKHSMGLGVARLLLDDEEKQL